jgi:hypothetical protein
MGDVMAGGECKKCGRCCEEAWSFTYEGVKILETGRHKITKAVFHNDLSGRAHNGPCLKLVYDYQTREAICLDQSDKKQICAEYPFHGEYVFEGCGFRHIYPRNVPELTGGGTVLPGSTPSDSDGQWPPPPLFMEAER